MRSCCAYTRNIAGKMYQQRRQIPIIRKFGNVAPTECRSGKAFAFNSNSFREPRRAHYIPSIARRDIEDTNYRYLTRICSRFFVTELN